MGGAEGRRSGPSDTRAGGLSSETCAPGTPYPIGAVLAWVSESMGIDRQESVSLFERNRRRSRDLFDAVVPDAYESRPIALRNPICFYEGHLPAFNVNTLVKRGLGEEGIDSGYEVLFERGIDPEDESDVTKTPFRWPSREAIQAYGVRADQRIREALLEKDITRAENPVLRNGLAAYTILEHEPMHQETLRYMWHRLPYEQKIRPAGAPRLETAGSPPRPEIVKIPAGTATLGTTLARVPFGWDNEFPEHRVDVPAFSIDAYNVTNRDFMEFLAAGGYENRAL